MIETHMITLLLNILKLLASKILKLIKWYNNLALIVISVPFPHPNLLRVVMMGKGCNVECTP